ncbi:MAG: pitrilysin family protein [Planctomycetia bacterium]|nr:pitrilysin family protein [Planctomycetia bacterium]
MDRHNRIHKLSNGITLLFEETPWSETFAAYIAVPSGKNYERDDKLGLATVTCEMTNRGAGPYNNRSFLEEFENLGLDSSEIASLESALFGSTGLLENWERALELLALQILSPRFDEVELEDCKQVYCQELAGIQDDPRAMTTCAIAELTLPRPWGRSPLGIEKLVENITIDEVRAFYSQYYRPNGTVIALAGRIDWSAAISKVEELFGSWQPVEVSPWTSTPSVESWRFIERDISQTHFRLGYLAPTLGDPDFERSNAAICVLSSGMSSRLFTEVREKRGLCYQVSASSYSFENLGAVFCYCGSSSDRAQEALDVIVEEFDKLRVTSIQPEELDRVKIGMKSEVVMQRESPIRRVASMISDWKILNRIRTLEETLEQINSVTCKAIDDYYSSRPLQKFNVVTLGKSPLEFPEDRLA